MAAMEPQKPAAPSRRQIDVDRSKYETVTDEARSTAGSRSDAQGYVAVDTETDCIDCIVAGSRGSAWRPRRTGPATSRSGTAARTLSERRTSCRCELVLGKLKPLLEDPAVLKIGHNLKYDWVMLQKAGIDTAPVDDTMVMSFDLDAGRSFGHGLDELAKISTSIRVHAVQAIVRTGPSRSTFDKVPLGPRPIMRERTRTSLFACG
jgi:DNA polymerase-1